MQATVHSLTILSSLYATVCLKLLYFVQYHGDISELLRAQSATGREVQDNRKSQNHTEYFLMSGHRNMVISSDLDK